MAVWSYWKKIPWHVWRHRHCQCGALSPVRLYHLYKIHLHFMNASFCRYVTILPQEMWDTHTGITGSVKKTF
jgi:hypothetical protein